jgi:CheY-like chemotaxis protein
LRHAVFDGAFLSVAVDGNAADCANIDVMRAIRSGQTMSNARTPVIALVNQCTQQCVDTLKAEGAHHVLIKPFRARALLEMMVMAFAVRLR